MTSGAAETLPERVEIEYSWFEMDRRNGYYPRCAEHGRMHRREALNWWDCVGFDGEGCPARITDEELFAYLRPDES